jgi:S1-C subfamily serine protease
LEAYDHGVRIGVFAVDGKKVPGMNRIRSFVLVLLLSGLSLAAEVRLSVVVVKPKLSDEGKAAYHSIAGYFRNNSLGDIADYFEALTKGGFGSGYIATDRFRRSVVVTNRHVVTFADSVTIILSNETGKETTIDECRIAYRDDDIDFAVILLPDEPSRSALTLELAESVPTDGEGVWSAGYPGLFGKPSWQLGKGVVTNRSVTVESLGLPEYAVFTQHSAPIDPGNSGGPLLIGDPSDSSSFKVVGINTWMVLGRQNVNFAVSLDKLREAFSRLPDPKETLDPAAAVRVKAGSLVTSLNAKEWSRFESSRFISSQMVMRQGWSAFTDMLPSLNDAEREDWVQRFLQASPVETLQQTVYSRIYKALHMKDQSVVLDSVDQLPDVDRERRVRTGLSAGKKVFYLDWHEDSGSWKVLEAGIPTAGLTGPRKRTEGAGALPKKRTAVLAASAEKMPSGGYPFPSGLNFGVGLTTIPTIYGWRLGLCQHIGYQFRIFRIASAGISAVVDQGASLIESGSQWTPMVVSLQGEARIGLPIPLANIALFPFVSGGVRAGIVTGRSTSDMFRLSIEGGLGLMVRPSSKWSAGVYLGPSFATDRGLRLESISISMFMIF